MIQIITLIFALPSFSLWRGYNVAKDDFCNHLCYIDLDLDSEENKGISTEPRSPETYLLLTETRTLGYQY